MKKAALLFMTFALLFNSIQVYAEEGEYPEDTGTETEEAEIIEETASEDNISAKRSSYIDEVYIDIDKLECETQLMTEDGITPDAYADSDFGYSVLDSVWVSAYEGESYTLCEDITQAGETYTAYIVLQAEEGYAFQDPLEIYVNDELLDDSGIVSNTPEKLIIVKK